MSLKEVTKATISFIQAGFQKDGEPWLVGDLPRGRLEQLTPSTIDVLNFTPQDRAERIEEMCDYLEELPWGSTATQSNISRREVMKSLLTAGYWAGSDRSKDRITETIEKLVLGRDPERSTIVLEVIVKGLGAYLFQDSLFIRNGMKATCGGTVVFPLKRNHEPIFRKCLEELAGFHKRQLAPASIQEIAREILISIGEGKRPPHLY